MDDEKECPDTAVVFITMEDRDGFPVSNKVRVTFTGRPYSRREAVEEALVRHPGARVSWVLAPRAALR